jgi:hypothetical protein
MNLADISFGTVMPTSRDWRWSGVDVRGGMLDGKLTSTDSTGARAEIEQLFAELAKPAVRVEWIEHDDRLEFRVQRLVESVSTAS